MQTPANSESERERERESQIQIFKSRAIGGKWLHRVWLVAKWVSRGGVSVAMWVYVIVARRVLRGECQFRVLVL